MGEQRESADLAVRTRIGQAVILHSGGDRSEARRRLAELWTELHEHGSALHRATVAHYLAQAQDEPEAGLEWDLRALAVADRFTREATAPSGPRGAHRPAATGELTAVRAVYPRLYLSLAGTYASLGEVRAAHEELRRTRSVLGGLRADDFVAGLRAAADRLERRLLTGGTGSG